MSEIVIQIILAVIGSGVLAGITWKIYTFFKNLVKTSSSIDELYKYLGENPISKLVDILKELRGNIAEISIRQRFVEENIEIGIYVCDIDGKCIWTNDWLNYSFGLDSSVMGGWGWIASLRKTDQLRVHDKWLLAIKQELPYKEEYWVDPKNAESWKALTEAFPVMVDNKVVCYVGYVVKQTDE